MELIMCQHINMQIYNCSDCNKVICDDCGIFLTAQCFDCHDYAVLNEDIELE